MDRKERSEVLLDEFMEIINKDARTYGQSECSIDALIGSLINVLIGAADDLNHFQHYFLQVITELSKVGTRIAVDWPQIDKDRKMSNESLQQ